MTCRRQRCLFSRCEISTYLFCFCRTDTLSKREAKIPPEIALDILIADCSCKAEVDFACCVAIFLFCLDLRWRSRFFRLRLASGDSRVSLSNSRPSTASLGSSTCKSRPSVSFVSMVECGAAVAKVKLKEFFGNVAASWHQRNLDLVTVIGTYVTLARRATVSSAMKEQQ